MKLCLGFNFKSISNEGSVLQGCLNMVF